jgi:hypothetical protein
MIGNQTPMHDGSRTPHYGNMVRKKKKELFEIKINFYV